MKFRLRVLIIAEAVFILYYELLKFAGVRLF